MYKIIRYRYFSNGYMEECLNIDHDWTVATNTPMQFQSRYSAQNYYNDNLRGQRCFAVGPHGGYRKLVLNEKSK